MGKLKYEIPAIVFLVCVILSCNEISIAAVKICVCAICVLGCGILSFLAAKDLGTILDENVEKKDKTTKELITSFNNAIEKCNVEQSEKLNQLMGVINQFNDVTVEYTKRVDILAEIQADIIKEQKNLSEKNEEIFTSLTNHFDDEHELFKNAIDEFNDSSEEHRNAQNRVIEESLEKINHSLNESGRDINDNLEKLRKEYERIIQEALLDEKDFFDDFQSIINSYLIRYEENVNESSEAIIALKALVQINLDAIKVAMKNQATEITEGLEDCSDAISEGLKEFAKQQKIRDEEQNGKINESIGTIETVISEQVGKVLSENEKLMSYIQKIQEEWTTLNRNEIEFLSRVWSE